jgi:hypothetical protein
MFLPSATIMDTTEHDPQRPLILSDMAGAEEWAPLESLVKKPDPPHILLVGNAGTGKSCALRLLLSSAIGFWLQCSQDPTLRDNRDRIKLAARRRQPEGKIHWIVLEHADLLHADAQAFLRRIIETSVGGTRFILEVRDLSAVAEPLLSRTVLVTGPHFLEHEICAAILRRVPDVSMERVREIAAQSGGNIRWAVLQALGGGDSLLSSHVPLSDTMNWSSILSFMEDVQRSGSSPRHAIRHQDGNSMWERAGGICPWSLLALALTKRIPGS